MTTWFTSDQHFGHDAIRRHCGRPFATVGDMNEALIQNHNAVVRDGDTVWHLGDFVWQGDPTLFLSRLRGRHILISGNHDRCHPLHSKHTRELRRYHAAGFVEVVTEFVALFDGLGWCHLNHFPLRKYAGADCRHLECRPERLASGCRWLLCGHVHEKWRLANECINVGVDQWGMYPVSAEQLVTFVEGLE